MLIMMPDDVAGSDTMVDRLSKENFLDIVDGLGHQDAEVLLPQLAAFTDALDLEPFFRKLGVKNAFDAHPTAVGGSLASNNNSTTNRSPPTVTLVSMKQNAYFSMSFITINSVGSAGTKLGRYIDMLVYYYHKHSVMGGERVFFKTSVWIGSLGIREFFGSVTRV